MEIIEILCSFKLVIEVQTGKEIPEKFSERFSANNFALSDAEDSNSGLLNRGVISDLPLLRTLSAIRQMFRELSSWKVMESFALLTYAILAASRTLLQRLIACLNKLIVFLLCNIVRTCIKSRNKYCLNEIEDLN